jgi:translation initiation factor IF-2
MLGVYSNIPLVNRPPVVTVMGHVDHGKTSLLDAIRKSSVASGESGGITQHIGAYQITTDGDQKITFIDTPGHEAFSDMRARGAQLTDILAVAADDGVMPQTVEAIKHAQDASVPIIVAATKIDRPNADLEKLKTELMRYNLIAEDYSGDVMVVPVSSTQNLNINKLIEALLLQAEVMELVAPATGNATGVVIESQIDKDRGITATFLVQKGTLKVGDIVVAGKSFGKVRSMLDDRKNNLKEVNPSTPVVVFGLNTVPVSGSRFAVVSSERQANEIASHYLEKEKAINTTVVRQVDGQSNMETLMEAFKVSTKKEIPVIIKSDVYGSIAPIVGLLGRIQHSDVGLKIIHTGVGMITESDASLAANTGALILGFNVRSDSRAQRIKDESNLDIRYYSIIYDLEKDVKAILSGMLKPIEREEITGKVEVRQVFKLTKVGIVAGCFVTDGTVHRGSQARIIRNGVVVGSIQISSINRFKEEVKEVGNGYECGIKLQNHNDVVQGDVFEIFKVIQEKQSL